MNFGPVVSTLTVETTYSELKWTAEWEVQGTMVLLPLNVVTAVEAILGVFCTKCGNCFLNC